MIFIAFFLSKERIVKAKIVKGAKNFFNKIKHITLLTAIPGEKMVNSLIFKENKGESLRKQILQPIDLKGKKPSPGITALLTKLLLPIYSITL